MIFEYMEYGDLAALLQANDPCSGVTPKVKLAEVGYILAHLPNDQRTNGKYDDVTGSRD